MWNLKLSEIKFARISTRNLILSYYTHFDITFYHLQSNRLWVVWFIYEFYFSCSKSQYFCSKSHHACSYIALFLFFLGNKIYKGVSISSFLTNRLLHKQDAMGAYTSASWFYGNCECGGIVRNHIFPDTLPYKYPYFSPFV